jgi:hypothetical protein
MMVRIQNYLSICFVRYENATHCTLRSLNIIKPLCKTDTKDENKKKKKNHTKSMHCCGITFRTVSIHEIGQNRSRRSSLTNPIRPLPHHRNVQIGEIRIRNPHYYYHVDHHHMDHHRPSNTMMPTDFHSHERQMMEWNRTIETLPTVHRNVFTSSRQDTSAMTISTESWLIRCLSQERRRTTPSYRTYPIPAMTGEKQPCHTYQYIITLNIRCQQWSKHKQMQKDDQRRTCRSNQLHHGSKDILRHQRNKAQQTPLP